LLPAQAGQAHADAGVAAASAGKSARLYPGGCQYAGLPNVFFR
jgi:hypothetical protein